MQAPQVQPAQRFFHVPKFQPPAFQKPAHVTTFAAPRQHVQPTQSIEFDGKRLRKAVTRKTVDYNSSVIKYLEVNFMYRFMHVFLNNSSDNVIFSEQIYMIVSFQKS